MIEFCIAYKEWIKKSCVFTLEATCLHNGDVWPILKMFDVFFILCCVLNQVGESVVRKVHFITQITRTDESCYKPIINH